MVERSSSGTVEALRLLNKIVDLVDNEDAGEPLDDAIGYARAAIKALDEVAQGDGTKLVYVRRWRTLVKLPVKYADEIVEALRAPAQSHPQLSALDDASNACLELAAKHGYATGHGDTVADMIREFSAQIPTFEGVEKTLTSHFYDGEPGDRTAIAEATKALMESRPVAQGSGWQPIETAPKDGSTILIVKADAEVPDACTAHFRNGRWACMTTEDWDASSEEVRDFAWYLNDATHWMPRPTPPVSSTD